MTDVETGRAAKPHMSRRLERQDREHAIDIAAHGAGAPGPPGPNRRRDVIDNRYCGRCGANPPRHTVGEIRAVDDDQNIRARGDNGVGSFTNAAQYQWQAAWDSSEPDDRKVVYRKWA